MNLTASQLELQKLCGRPIRALSVAGTGKTSTLAMRVKYLVENVTSAEAILVMTFSRKAAFEIKNKVKLQLNEATSKIAIGTFHAVAINEIKSHPLFDKKLHIFDEEDSQSAWEQAFMGKAIPFPKQLTAIFFEGSQPEDQTLDKAWYAFLKSLCIQLREIRNQQANQYQLQHSFQGYAHKKLLERCEIYLAISQECSLLKWIEDGLAGYEEIKLEGNAQDYNDILLNWLKILSSDIEYQNEVRQRWSHVLIDEYQDTNYLQEAIVNQLNTDNLVVFGDPGQCLYSWRSAQPEIIMNFKERYPNAQDILLQTNFRSKQNILNLANHVLAQHDAMVKSRGKFDFPLLQLESAIGNGGEVKIIHAQNAVHEASITANKIEKLIRYGTDPEDICVLARTSYYLRSLELLCKSRNIKSRFWGGHSILDSKTVKEFNSLLKLTLRPNDFSSFRRLALLLPKVGERGAEKLFLQWKLGYSLESHPSDFTTTLTQLHDLNSKHEPSSTHELETMIHVALEFLKKLHSVTNTISWQKESEFNALKVSIDEVMKQFSMSQKSLSLADLVSELSLDPLMESSELGSITLSTIHQAKGLEWPHVFVVGCQEGKIPLLREKDKEISPEALEEECRALYVAITRAKDHLTLSFAGERTECSRFLTSYRMTSPLAA